MTYETFLEGVEGHLAHAVGDKDKARKMIDRATTLPALFAKQRSPRDAALLVGHTQTSAGQFKRLMSSCGVTLAQYRAIVGL